MSQRHPLAVLIYISLVALLLSVKELRSTFAAISLIDPPVAVDDSYSIHNQTLLKPMTNDYHPDGYGLFFNAIETQPQHGILIQYNAEWYTYRPNYGYTGSDSFTYSIKDSSNNIDVGTVNLTVVNQAPIAVPDFYIKSGPLLITPAANDYDPDPDPLNFQSIVTQPQHGTLSQYYFGVYTYSPTSGYTGFDSFTYRIVDSLGATNEGTVYLLVLSQAPPAAPIPYDCAPPADPPGRSCFNPGTGRTPTSAEWSWRSFGARVT